VLDVRFVSIASQRADQSASPDTAEEEEEKEGGWRGFGDSRGYAGRWYTYARLVNIVS
jgi:hypothetical protein